MNNQESLQNSGKGLDFRGEKRVNGDDMEAIVAPNLQLLSLDEVCRRLNIGHWMIYKLIGDDKISTVKIGKRRFVTIKALSNFIEWLERGGDG
jgi:excisionase family DNA binding protein